VCCYKIVNGHLHGLTALTLFIFIIVYIHQV